MQREVKDDRLGAWTCAQAYAGLQDGGEAAKAAAERAAGDDGTVHVVCTPDGGEQSVRLKLPAGWEESMSDAELLAAIDAARDGG